MAILSAISGNSCLSKGYKAVLTLKAEDERDSLAGCMDGPDVLAVEENRRQELRIERRRDRCFDR